MIPDYADAFFLGFVQGVTEFLPVSSSGHLALAGIWGRGAPTYVAFDILLHLATALVVVVAFAGDMAAAFRRNRHIFGLLVLATLPAGVGGVLFKEHFEGLRESPTAIGAALLLTGCWLIFTEHRAFPEADAASLTAIGWRRALLIGLIQIAAMTPGISRSGVTVGAGLLLGLQRAAAVKFSFLLMLPIVIGAAGLEAIDLIRKSSVDEIMTQLPPGPCLLGMTVAAGMGLLALRLLTGMARAGRLKWFGFYCLIMGLTAVLVGWW